MSAVPTAPQPDIAAIEEHLSTGVFGDTSMLQADAHTYYEGTARLLMDVSGTAGESTWPDSPQAQALWRGLLDEALGAWNHDRGRGRALVAELVELSGSREDAALDADGRRSREFADTLVACRAWASHHLGRRLVDRLNQTMANDGHPYRASATDPTESDERSLAAASGLALALLPRLTPAVWRNVHGAGLFEGNLSSAFISGTPGVVFVNRDRLDEALRAGDALLHESLHQKLMDIEVTRTVLRPGYRDEDSHLIDVTWAGEHRRFSVDRSLAAFHVYVHLTLLHVAATRDPDSVPGCTLEEIVARTVVRASRGAHFARELATAEAQAELGPDGRSLVAWLTEAQRLNEALLLPDGSRVGDHDDWG